MCYPSFNAVCRGAGWYQKLLRGARVGAQRVQHRPRLRARLIGQRGNQHVGGVRQDAVNLQWQRCTPGSQHRPYLCSSAAQ